MDEAEIPGYVSIVSLRYSITKEDSVIHVRTEGVFDFLEAYEMWEKIVLACTTHNCQRVLGVSNLDEPLPEADAYEHLGILESVGITPDHRIAWVAGNPELLPNLRLTEMVIGNRSSLVLRAFEKEREAKRWLANSR